VSELELCYSGYVCAPYLHTHESVDLKESWIHSKNIEDLFFVTSTFSTESKPYFPESSNHYLLAKFKNNAKILKDLTKHNQDQISFQFNISDELFQRDIVGDTNFVSIYYMEYGEDGEYIQDLADLLVKKSKIEKASLGNLKTYCTIPQKFTFPHFENIIILEVGSEKSYQSVNKYCDQTRRDANRRGLTMTSLMSLSILDKLK
jgi:hypothetical protein